MSESTLEMAREAKREVRRLREENRRLREERDLAFQMIKDLCQTSATLARIDEALRVGSGGTGKEG